MATAHHLDHGLETRLSEVVRLCHWIVDAFGPTEPLHGVKGCLLPCK